MKRLLLTLALALTTCFLTAGAETLGPDIAPLLQSQWGQSGCFNRLTPLQDGVRCATGCVPTAYAQIMYYHRWPTGLTAAIAGYDQASKSSSGGLNGVEPGDTLPPTVFAWDQMLDAYGDDADPTDEAADAVAELMFYAGVALRAVYRPGSTDAVATDHLNISRFIAAFGYSPAARVIDRMDYSTAEWERIIYGELQAGRPVIYSAEQPRDSHCFVIDGYSRGLFHVNWGWNGTNDGYYDLNTLNPLENNALEVYADQFSCAHQAVIHLCPPQEGDEEDPQYKVDGFDSPQAVAYGRASAADDFRLSVSLHVSSQKRHSAAELGLGLYDGDSLLSVMAPMTIATDGNGCEGLFDIAFGHGVSDATYDLKPVYRYGTRGWQRCVSTGRRFASATIAGDSLHLRVVNTREMVPTSPENVAIDTVAVGGSLFSGRAVEFAVSLDNRSDFHQVPLWLWYEGEGRYRTRITAYLRPHTRGTVLMHDAVLPVAAGTTVAYYITTDQEGTERVWQSTYTTREEDPIHLQAVLLPAYADNAAVMSGEVALGDTLWLTLAVTNTGRRTFDWPFRVSIESSDKAEGYLREFKSHSYRLAIAPQETVEVVCGFSAEDFDLEHSADGDYQLRLYYYPIDERFHRGEVSSESVLLYSFRVLPSGVVAAAGDTGGAYDAAGAAFDASGVALRGTAAGGVRLVIQGGKKWVVR